MKGLSGFGKPGRQRYSIQYGYDARRSWWHEVKAHAHLVIAAVGTMALLAVAAIGLWLAMPSEERQAFAEAKTTAATPAAEAPPTQPVEVQPVETATAAPVPEAPAVQAAVPELDPQAAAAIAVPAEGETQAMPETMPMTAAIPTPRPEPAGEAGATNDDKPATAGKAAGHTVRAVTMRSGPKTGAAAIGTVPGGTAIEVVACTSWCEIVYKGQRGFVYKSFVARD